MTFSVKIGSILSLLCLIFAWKSMSSIDFSETALSNERDVWRFLILRVVRGVLDLAILEATIRLVAFDVISLLFFKLERISFGISSDYEFITASYITRTEFGDWELTTVLIATAFFHGDFSQLMLSAISLTLLRVIVERFLNGNSKFNLTWNGEFWLFFLSFSVSLSLCLRFQSFSLVPSTFWYDLFAWDFLLYSSFLSLWSSFSLFVSFERFSAFLCLSFSFSVSSLFSLFFCLHRFFFLRSSKGFPILVYPFLFLFFLCFPLKKSIVKLHHFVYKHVTIGVNQVGYQYKNQNLVVNHIKILKSVFLLSLFYLSYWNFWNWPTV